MNPKTAGQNQSASASYLASKTIEPKTTGQGKF